MDIGDKIRAAREVRGLRRADLARRLSMPPSNISRWETGKVSPTWSTLVRIAKALEISPEELAADEGRGSRAETAPLFSASLREVPRGRGGRDPDIQLRRIPTLDEAKSSTPSEERLAAEQDAQASRSRALSRLMRLPRFAELKDSISLLPEDITQDEIRQLAGVIAAYFAGRKPSDQSRRRQGRDRS